ncbi:MAG: polysaccharide lyase [Planctomycetota bacterium]
MLPLLMLSVVWSFPSESLLRSCRGPTAARLTDEMLRQYEPAILWSNVDDRVKLLVDDRHRGHLRVSYPGSAWGSDSSGAQIKFKVPASESATCQYRLRFAEGFEFAKGGKLPGLAGGTATTGRKRPSGDGWTARLMWRRYGDAVLYLYHLDQRERYGDDFPLNVRFQANRWYDIRQRVTVNREHQNDGRVQVWVDGQEVLDQRNLRLRLGNAAPVDLFYFSTFFGGRGSDWAPSTDQSIDFADFSVW